MTTQATVARPATGGDRDRAVTGMILDIAGAAWFGWGQDAA